MSTQFRVRSVSTIDDNKDLSPLLERLYGARGIESVNQLDYSLKQLLNPKDIYGLSDCAVFIAEKIINQSKILIVGDYDADGATSTALLVKGLSLLGLKQIDYVLPDRMTEGYGLSEGLVNRVLKLNPDIIITVDTGISSLEGVKRLREADIDVVVTDHHLPAESLPDANFIVNPNAYNKQISPKGRCLAGVGVAFYLLLAIRSELRHKNHFSDAKTEPNLATLLDYVALGTVADLVPLDHLNRVLVSQGLSLIQQDRCCEGIKQLFLVSSKNQNTANHQDLGFAIGPRINAAGRIDNMALGVQCLLSSGTDAKHLAMQLDDINKQRRALQTDMQIDSDSLLAQLLGEDGYPKGVVLCHKDWHEGVVGIVASQIKAKTYRPCFVFAYSEGETPKETMLKGSGRSIPGIHLRDVLDLIDKRNKGLIIKFGGHAMAAGLSINAHQLDQFQQALVLVLDELYTDDVFLQSRLTDGELEHQQLSLETADTLNNAGPWGQCFEEPEFVGTFKVIQQRALKQQHLKLVLSSSTEPDTQTVDAIAFFCDESLLNGQLDSITICYKLSINEFRGNRSLQLMVNEFIDTQLI